MSLTPGARLGPYEIIAAIGAGGMGEVYKARDTRLDRTVAIKILPETLSGDSEARERFDREARAISQLDHPHICALFDVGDAPNPESRAPNPDRIQFLVMQYLEGETLADRLARGPLPLDQALKYASEIAGALDKAHRAGIWHRDLKPANVMLTKGGATLLDFGLAKQANVGRVLPSGPAGSKEPPQGGRQDPAYGLTMLPTRTRPLTMQGMILGTFQYMAPEQVEGKEADARTDIWGFGCLLYEMLTGRRAFDAATQAALIAAILERQPQPIDLASSTIAPAVKRLVAACLEKDPAERFQTMRDIRRELEWLPGRVSSDAAAPSHASRWQVLAWRVALPVLLLIAVLIATLFATRRFATPAAAMPAVVLNVGLPWNDAMVSSPSVSPEGTRIAFIAQTGAGESIWIRRVDAMQAQPLKGTTGVRRGSMFWSPDGKSLGFFSSGKLRTIELATERVDVICDAPVGFGGTWGADGTILFSPDERSPIYRVSAQGGAPAPATVLDAGRHEHAHRWPQFLPDGRHFVFMVWNSGTTTRPIQIASLDGTPPRTLFEAQTAAFVAGDYLLFVNDHPARLMAWAFDAQTLQLRGKPFAAVPDDNVDYAWPSGDPMAAASTTGTLAYTTGQRRTSRLTWFSRTGRPLGTVGEPGVYYDPALSPDGSTMAVEKHDWERFSGDIWTVDLSRGAFSRLTTAPGFENVAIWSPDGRQIAFSSDQEKVQKIFVKNASGSGADQVLIAKESRSYATDWSSDGRHVLFMTDGGTTGLDVWSYDVEHRTSSPLLASPFSEALAKFSPDGKWIAYVSDEAQQRQVFVQSFPGGAVKIQISTAGGNEPEWRRDGKELFYLTTDGTLMAVGIQVAGGQIHVGTTEPLFVTNIEQFRGIRNEYTASSDGQRFLVVNPLVDRDASPIVAVLNWRGVPAR